MGRQNRLAFDNATEIHRFDCVHTREDTDVTVKLSLDVIADAFVYSCHLKEI